MVIRVSPNVARVLGISVPKKPFAGVNLPSLAGHPALARMTERDLQRSALDHFRRALVPPCRVFAIPNQRTMDRKTDESKLVTHKILSALIADGMEPGASDTISVWDMTKGAPGNRGLCWIEYKRPVNPPPVSEDQLKFIEAMREIGFVAGWAQSLEQAEALYEQAGAPLRIRLLTPGINQAREAPSS